MQKASLSFDSLGRLGTENRRIKGPEGSLLPTGRRLILKNMSYPEAAAEALFQKQMGELTELFSGLMKEHKRLRDFAIAATMRVKVADLRALAAEASADGNVAAIFAQASVDTAKLEGENAALCVALAQKEALLAEAMVANAKLRAALREAVPAVAVPSQQAE